MKHSSLSYQDLFTLSVPSSITCHMSATASQITRNWTVLFNELFRLTASVVGSFSSQGASNEGSISMSWRIVVIWYRGRITSLTHILQRYITALYTIAITSDPVMDVPISLTRPEKYFMCRCRYGLCKSRIQVTDHFSSIFSALLSAFRKKYSCQSTLLNMIENFKCALDKGEYVACISMDISKAFDCLPHCLTICKLHAYGFSMDACKFIASYLYKRKQRVKIGEIKSDWKEINKGVPQGSILGPLIFNIFMNDLFYFITQGNLFNYADDNSISVNHVELHVVSHLLQAEAEATVQWFSENSMQANPAKFQGILLKGNKYVSDFKVSIRGQDVDFSKSISALGVCIDENLTFDTHVDNICLKASRQISALQRLTGLLDLPSRKAIYTSFIFSNFNYCPLVWFFTSRASITKIQKLQERALRFVLKDSTSDYETLLSKGGFDSFRISALKTMAVEIYKILNGMGPKYLSPLLSRSITPYNLRDQNKLIQPLKRTTTFGIKSLAYYGTHLWNILPHDVKGALTLNNFKTLMRKWVGPTCGCSVCNLVI